MPVKLEIPSSACTPSSPSVQPSTSVVDIQGTWRETKTMTVWKVDGIVAQKHKQRSKAVVLSDSPNGVEWGMGNLMGTIEDGILSWRSRTGQVAYQWGRCWLDPESPKQAPKSNAALRSLPGKHEKEASRQVKHAKEAVVAVAKQNPEESLAHLSSPRSTSSTVSTAPTDTAAGLKHGAGGIGGELPKQAMRGNKQTKQTSNEVEKLLEMAGSRLASGDYGTAMQYVLFAQTLDAPRVAQMLDAPRAQTLDAPRVK